MRLAVFYSYDSIGGKLLLCELCTHGICMGMVAVAEYRYVVGIMVDPIGSISNRYTD